MKQTHWQPTASLETLRARAAINEKIRRFFAVRDVLEVEVPLLAEATVTDPHIQSVVVPASEGDRYLQTSPEFAMKRLLAAGSGPIYSLGKAFRRDEVGRRHNPEFTLLEWYQPGYDDQMLIDEVAVLLQSVLVIDQIDKLSYRELFQEHLGIDPHTTSVDTLKQLAQQFIEADLSNMDKDAWLDLLLTHVIEPRLTQGLTFIYDYPASQAALAKLQQDTQGQWVAKRFEAYVGGMELANGYWELTDAAEQRRRFDSDLSYRQAHQLFCPALAERLLSALAAGLPDCAGVALGVDRLVMLAMQLETIADVVAFPFDRA